ncbi:MAG: aspartate aminotransferase family protein [Geminicoccaceae bacterium]|nr:aspartate aminotransferase family protein [Geminicoccaceae bacterium]
MPIYRRIDLAFEHGEGSWLFTKDGRRFLDFAAGIAVCGLGHAHPHLVHALQEQAARLWHVSNLFRIEPLERLADRLVAHSFADTAFLCNSGAEAIEASIKLVRRYHWAAGHPERHKIVTFEGSFHGRTMAGISAAGGGRLTEGYAPLLEGFVHLPFGDHEALRAALADPAVGAVLVEPIQGEGGIRPLPPQCLEGLREACDETGALLVYDEVQCGMGRTGHLFAYQHSGVTPDVMALAKGLGGGFPIGACLATARAASGMTPGSHGSTFGGNPLACSVANAVLDVMLEPGFLDGVAERARYLRAGLEGLRERHAAQLPEVRGLGLMLGLKLAVPNLEAAAALRANGLLTVPAGDNVLRLLPPLTVSEAEIDEALALIGRTFAGMGG